MGRCQQGVDGVNRLIGKDDLPHGGKQAMVAPQRKRVCSGLRGGGLGGHPAIQPAVGPCCSQLLRPKGKEDAPENQAEFWRHLSVRMVARSAIRFNYWGEVSSRPITTV